MFNFSGALTLAFCLLSIQWTSISSGDDRQCTYTQLKIISNFAFTYIYMYSIKESQPFSIYIHILNQRESAIFHSHTYTQPKRISHFPFTLIYSIKENQPFSIYIHILNQRYSTIFHSHTYTHSKRISHFPFTYIYSIKENQPFSIHTHILNQR